MKQTHLYRWECHPKAEQLILNTMEECCQGNPFIENFRQELLKQTSTRLFDWLDHLVLGNIPGLEGELSELEFIISHVTPTYRIFSHPGAQLPRLIIRDHEKSGVGVGIKVDSVAEFLMVRGMSGWIEGRPFSAYRQCCVSNDNGVSMWVVERRGGNGVEPTYPDICSIQKYVIACEKWQSRSRDLKDEKEAMRQTLAIGEEIITTLGEDLAAWAILECERKYWQSRNTAAQIQKNRQDRLGMGWANHDHHTFRSSRQNFPQLVRLFEMLGFSFRERFYAGEEAGWGAQVMENPRCGLVLFLDLDLSPKELEIDFAHQPLPVLNHLGTVGLWCALHGDSILKSGMHHLEAQFMFEDLSRDLSHHGIAMMDPFSNFPFLKQAFTHGEIWHVDPVRVQKVLEKGMITKEEAKKFKKNGAVGSHLENLQRREGYKGFNQKNVSDIIQKTDPRVVASE